MIVGREKGKDVHNGGHSFGSPYFQVSGEGTAWPRATEETCRKIVSRCD